MLNPRAPNLNVSARMLPKVMLGVWFFSSIGAIALQVALTLNFGGEGIVPDRRGLNISSIYGMDWWLFIVYTTSLYHPLKWSVIGGGLLLFY